MARPAWVLQQIVPPLGLTYFFVCWRICTFDLGPGYISALSGSRYVGNIYSAFATITISLITILYLRLYFLPHNQSTPPFNPPTTIRAKKVIFECLSPAEASTLRSAHPELRSPPANDNSDLLSEATPTSSSPNPPPLSADESGEPLVNRCCRDTCAGRWKPPRARHCSLCKTCRAGFDHHCAIFANCLTAPHIPAFLCLLSITPPTVLTLVAPLLPPLIRRARTAWGIACENEDIARRWWGWKPSWIVAGGPVGRWAGGLILGWKVLDRQDEGGGYGAVRLQIGILVFLGLIFSAICIALAFATTTVIRAGNLTVDRERLRSYSRAIRAAWQHPRLTPSDPIPQHLQDQIERYTERHWFFVPIPNHKSGGVILPTLAHERAYDLGEQGDPAWAVVARRSSGADANWTTIMGEGWGWLLPWSALRRGMSMEEVCQWPIAKEVEERLRAESVKIAREEAERIARAGSDELSQTQS